MRGSSDETTQAPGTFIMSNEWVWSISFSKQAFQELSWTHLSSDYHLESTGFYKKSISRTALNTPEQWLALREHKVLENAFQELPWTHLSSDYHLEQRFKEQKNLKNCPEHTSADTTTWKSQVFL